MASDFWRSWFERAFLAWGVIALAFWLGITRVLEVMGKGMALAWLALFLLAPLALIVWAIRRAATQAGKWAIVGAVVVAWAVLVAAGIPLYRASVYLNFWSHRAAYDAVVADMKAGRLAAQREGVRHGVKYNSPMMRSGDVGFLWYWDFDVGQGVYYDETECPHVHGRRSRRPKRHPSHHRRAPRRHRPSGTPADSAATSSTLAVTTATSAFPRNARPPSCPSTAPSSPCSPTRFPGRWASR